MTATNFSLSNYLARIRHDGEVYPELPTLTTLMSAQLQYENL